MTPTTNRGLVIGPRWLERGRTDGDSLGWPADSAGHGGRHWTLVGNLGAPGDLDTPRAAVDPSGLVAPRLGGWTLDWWIGAEDRWHLPSRETAVRQRLIDEAPVVETAMRLPGGDVVHRVFAVRTTSGTDAVIVEIENATPVPFAVALAVRPYGVDGPASVRRVELRGTELSVDGQPAVVLPRPPNRTAAGTWADGDCAATVLAGDAVAGVEFSVTCDGGAAQAAMLYPLPHTATLRVLLPQHAVGEGPGTSAGAGPDRQPSAVQVASGWRSQSDTGARVVMPPGRLADAVEVNRRYLLLAAGGTGESHVTGLDRSTVVGTLDRWGFGHDAGTLLAAQAGLDEEALVPPSDHRDSEGAALVAVADHVRLAGDDDLLEVVLPGVADAARRVRRLAGGARLGRRGARGLLPAGAQPTWLAPGRYYRDDLWAVAGLVGAAEMLARAGEARAAATAQADAAALWAVLPRGFAADAEPSEPLPAGPDLPGADADRSAPAGLVANLVACEPLALLPFHHPLVSATVELLRCVLPDAGGVPPLHGPVGVSPELTLALVATELAGGDPMAMARLDQVVGWASSTWGWPEVVDPVTGEGVGGGGHHLPTAAAFLRVVRDLFVRDEPDRLVLLSVFPPAWLGQSLEVHGAPTRFGTLSYAVRWHGERPALLWELDPHDGVTTATIQAPGLDQTWRGAGLRGDALLAPPAGIAP